jgi:hypothetical protein
LNKKNKKNEMQAITLGLFIVEIAQEQRRARISSVNLRGRRIRRKTGRERKKKNSPATWDVLSLAKSAGM